MNRIVLFALGTAFIFGCGKNGVTVGSQTQMPEDAVRTAIQAHLAHNGNLNLQAFDTDVKQVTIQGDHAHADVEFRVKNGPGAMQLSYALEKRDGAWSVIEGDPTISNFSHPALGQGQNPSEAKPPTASHSLAETLRSFKATATGVPAEGPLGPREQSSPGR